jgi:hypothetical protein
MKILPTSLLAGVASIALAGTVAAHTLTLQLQVGTSEQITYSGDDAPQVAITPAPSPAVAGWTFGPQSPFALMQQIAARMDREADAMMRLMQQIAAQPLTGPVQAMAIDMSQLPPGTESYSFVSTLSPSGVCSQSTEIIAKGRGQKPQVITHRSGNCGAPAAPGAATHVAMPDRAPAIQAAPPRAQSDQAKAIDHPDYRSMFREASW